MKRLISATALSLVLASGTVHAGSLADPIIEAPVIVQDAGSSAGSSSGALLPIALAVLIAAAVSRGSGGGMVISDARLKTDITRVGVTRHGLPLYHYRYVGGDQMFEGVMAQDVQRVMPDAVKPAGYGYLAVDYDLLGLEMREVH